MSLDQKRMQLDAQEAGLQFQDGLREMEAEKQKIDNKIQLEFAKVRMKEHEFHSQFRKNVADRASQFQQSRIEKARTTLDEQEAAQQEPVEITPLNANQIPVSPSGAPNPQASALEAQALQRAVSGGRSVQQGPPPLISGGLQTPEEFGRAGVPVPNRPEVEAGDLTQVERSEVAAPVNSFMGLLEAVGRRRLGIGPKMAIQERFTIPTQHQVETAERARKDAILETEMRTSQLSESHQNRRQALMREYDPQTAASIYSAYESGNESDALRIMSMNPGRTAQRADAELRMLNQQYEQARVNTARSRLELEMTQRASTLDKQRFDNLQTLQSMGLQPSMDDQLYNAQVSGLVQQAGDGSGKLVTDPVLFQNFDRLSFETAARSYDPSNPYSMNFLYRGDEKNPVTSRNTLASNAYFGVLHDPSATDAAKADALQGLQRNYGIFLNPGRDRNDYTLDMEKIAGQPNAIVSLKVAEVAMRYLGRGDVFGSNDLQKQLALAMAEKPEETRSILDWLATGPKSVSDLRLGRASVNWDRVRELWKSAKDVVGAVRTGLEAVGKASMTEAQAAEGTGRAILRSATPGPARRRINENFKRKLGKPLGAR